MSDTTFSALLSATGTANQITVTGGLQPVYSISDNPVLPGTAGATLPSGTTGQRAGGAGTLRFNTTSSVFESTIDGVTYRTFSNAAGTILSLSGTANRISVTAGSNPVVDISATYIGQNSITTLGTVTTGIWNASIIPLAYGGSNANLVASNGGLIWSNATQMQVLAGTATARQMLQSGATATPAWSTATWPATTTANQILYSSATNTVSEIASVNSATLVTSSAGVPTLSAMTNGQLIIGSTGATPVAASLTAGNGIAITPGSGSIALSVTGGTLRSVQVLNSGIGATYTKPAGINAILVEMVGGGGAGGGAICTAGVTTSAGAGGGAGEYKKIIFNPAAATYNYNIGTAGSPGAAGNNPGGDGGDTIFSTITVTGGNGGGGCPESTGSQVSFAPGTGGSGGSGASSIDISGGSGGYGSTSLVAWAISGYGGDSILGPGGASLGGAAINGDGMNADANSGAGGGGGIAANSIFSAKGGIGGSGRIIVWEFA